jgi:N-succinyldiaminopimelate aminotransferase
MSAVLPSSIGDIAIAATEFGATDLALGSPDSDPYSVWGIAAASAISTGESHYSDVPGRGELRSAIFDYYGTRGDDGLGVEAVCVTAGATEGISAALMSLEPKGGEVIIFEPFYEGYLRAIKASGATPRPVRLTHGDWKIDVNALVRAVGPRTIAAIFNSPHNPTGRVFSEDEVAAVENILRNTKTIILSDDVYSEFYYGAMAPAVIGQSSDFRDRVLRINSASKMFGVTGWRVGWVAGPRPLVSRVVGAHFALTACAPTPLQVGVAAGLREIRHVGESLREQYVGRKNMVRDIFTDIGFEVSSPEGGFYLIVSSRQYKKSEVLYNVLLKDVGVATVPLPLFYADEGVEASQVRVAFCKPQEILAEASVRLSVMRQPQALACL